MSTKRIWQATVVASLITAALGTVTLAADTLGRTQSASGALLQLAGDEHSDEKARGEDEDRDSRADASRVTGGDGTRWIGLEQATAVVNAAGYSDIYEVEREGRGYEVKARDADGRRWELKVDGHSGEIVARERE